MPVELSVIAGYALGNGRHDDVSTVAGIAGGGEMPGLAGSDGWRRPGKIGRLRGAKIWEAYGNGEGVKKGSEMIAHTKLRF